MDELPVRDIKFYLSHFRHIKEADEYMGNALHGYNTSLNEKARRYAAPIGSWRY